MKNTLLMSAALALVCSTAALAGVVTTPEPGTSTMMIPAVLGGLGFAAWKLRKKK